VEATFTDWMPGGSLPYTPGGMAYRLQWGTLRYTGKTLHFIIIFKPSHATVAKDVRRYNYLFRIKKSPSSETGKKTKSKKKKKPINKHASIIPYLLYI
jgi:hypothetical protein